MQKWPETINPVLLRTDFSDEAAWGSLCTAARSPNDDGFQANIDCISDRSFDGLAVDQVMALARKASGHPFAFIADQVTITDPERPVLVVDLSPVPGRPLRVIPSQMWGVENNLSLANMEYSEFADHVDPDGVFRGFPRS